MVNYGHVHNGHAYATLNNLLGWCQDNKMKKILVTLWPHSHTHFLNLQKNKPKYSAIGHGHFGTASVFGVDIRRFESCRPSHFSYYIFKKTILVIMDYLLLKSLMKLFQKEDSLSPYAEKQRLIQNLLGIWLLMLKMTSLKVKAQ